MNQTIAVVIPTYNRAQYICKTVQSVVDQTFRDFDIIVVDDGSTDDTEEVLRPFMELPNFRYVYQTNKGRSIARNTGAELANAEWVMYLDSDDYLERNCLTTLWNLAKEAKDSGFVYANFLFVNNDHQLFGHRAPFFGKELNKNMFLDMLSDTICLTKTGTFLVKRELVIEIGGFSTKFEPSEDLEILMRVFSKVKVSYVDDTVLYVRRHETNTDEMEIQEVVIKICKHYLATPGAWQGNLSAKEIRKARSAFKIRIANAYYELDKHRQAFAYYFGLVGTEPSRFFDKFIFKQLIASLLPGTLKKMIKSIPSIPSIPRMSLDVQGAGKKAMPAHTNRFTVENI